MQNNSDFPDNGEAVRKKKFLNTGLLRRTGGASKPRPGRENDKRKFGGNADGHSVTRVENASIRDPSIDKLYGISMDRNRLIRNLGSKRSRLPSMQAAKGLSVTAEAPILHD